MIYVTGDRHGVYKDLKNWCWKKKTTKDDVLVILGDAGINYLAQDSLQTVSVKAFIEDRLPITLFCIHGNHEARPSTLDTHHLTGAFGGEVWVDERAPHTFFAKDNTLYNLGGYNVYVMGGAYSVDKYYRLACGRLWFEDEQPSEDVKAAALSRDDLPQNLVVMTHTCPKKYIPTEMFLDGVDQSTVDDSTEVFLDKLEEKLDYRAWLCGHWHTDKWDERVRFMFHDIVPLSEVVEHHG